MQGDQSGDKIQKVIEIGIQIMEALCNNPTRVLPTDISKIRVMIRHSRIG